MTPRGRLVTTTAALGAAMLVFSLVPEGRLACSVERQALETSPDGAWTLTLCRRPTWFAMPGGSGDAPGWIVLRDRSGAIRGVSHLSMVQAYGNGGGGAAWQPDRVIVPLTADLPLAPAPSRLRRWLDDRIWRWRALLGATPTDEAFH